MCGIGSKKAEGVACGSSIQAAIIADGDGVVGRRPEWVGVSVCLCV